MLVYIHPDSPFHPGQVGAGARDHDSLLSRLELLVAADDPITSSSSSSSSSPNPRRIEMDRLVSELRRHYELTIPIGPIQHHPRSRRECITRYIPFSSATTPTTRSTAAPVSFETTNLCAKYGVLPIWQSGQGVHVQVDAHLIPRLAARLDNFILPTPPSRSSPASLTMMMMTTADGNDDSAAPPSRQDAEFLAAFQSIVCGASARLAVMDLHNEADQIGVARLHLAEAMNHWLSDQANFPGTAAGPLPWAADDNRPAWGSPQQANASGLSDWVLLRGSQVLAALEWKRDKVLRSRDVQTFVNILIGTGGTRIWIEGENVVTSHPGLNGPNFKHCRLLLLQIWAETDHHRTRAVAMHNGDVSMLTILPSRDRLILSTIVDASAGRYGDAFTIAGLMISLALINGDWRYMTVDIGQWWDDNALSLALAWPRPPPPSSSHPSGRSGLAATRPTTGFVSSSIDDPIMGIQRPLLPGLSDNTLHHHEDRNGDHGARSEHRAIPITCLGDKVSRSTLDAIAKAAPRTLAGTCTVGEKIGSGRTWEVFAAKLRLAHGAVNVEQDGQFRLETVASLVESSDPSPSTSIRHITDQHSAPRRPDSQLVHAPPPPARSNRPIPSSPLPSSSSPESVLSQLGRDAVESTLSSGQQFTPRAPDSRAKVDSMRSTTTRSSTTQNTTTNTSTDRSTPPSSASPATDRFLGPELHVVFKIAFGHRLAQDVDHEKRAYEIMRQGGVEGIDVPTWYGTWSTLTLLASSPSAMSNGVVHVCLLARVGDAVGNGDESGWYDLPPYLRAPYLDLLESLYSLGIVQTDLEPKHVRLPYVSPRWKREVRAGMYPWGHYDPSTGIPRLKMIDFDSGAILGASREEIEASRREVRAQLGLAVS